LNNDGFLDIVTGNHGQNSFFKSSLREPLTMYVSDFDQNGSDEQIITHYDNGESYPMHQKSDLVAQLPYLKKNLLNFRSYRNKSMKDLFNESVLQNALILRAYDMKSAAWINKGHNAFERLDLPSQAQYFPVYALLIDDFTNDGVKDLLIGGNLYRAKPETGLYGAGYGLLLKGDGAGGFRSMSPGVSGLSMTGEIRSLATITDGHRNKILFGMNNKSIKVLRYEKRTQ
jgi:hypothetical protein